VNKDVRDIIQQHICS